jgi:hydrogenase maturation protein HypF
MEALGPVRAFPLPERPILRDMCARGINSPYTSAAGRLFDAVAAILGLHLGHQFEGQAAMALEFALDESGAEEAYPTRIREQAGALILDWEPMVQEVLTDVARGVPVSRMALAFHNSLAESIVAVARRIGEERIVLTGGCFQNRYLSERTVARLRAEGFRPYWHQRIPPNDGGIALGQILGASQAKGKWSCA